MPRSHPTLAAPRLPALDGVRGLAILLVLAAHAFQANSAAAGPLTRVLSGALNYGIMGVDLFFVLSGFLITGILVDTRSAPRFFSSFYIRRVLRIFPLYYGVLLTLFALTLVLPMHWNGMGWLLLFDLQNLRPDQIGTFAPNPRIGLYHFWSLAVEEQFYLLWPAAVFFTRSRRTLLGMTLALSAAALVLRLILITTGTGLLAIHVSTLCRADSLLLGGALALLYRSRLWPTVLRLAPGVALAALALIALSIASLGPDPNLRDPGGPHAGPALFWFEGFRYTVLAIGFAALIAWSLRPLSRLAGVFSHPVLRFFGRLSYGIYILHAILLTSLTPPLRAYLFALTGSKAAAVLGSGMLEIALSVVAAMLSYRFVESPFLRLKRRFESHDLAPTRDISPTGSGRSREVFLISLHAGPLKILNARKGRQ